MPRYRNLSGQSGVVAYDTAPDSITLTFVNGDRVPATMLKDGDKIRIGSTTILKFSYSDRDEEQYQKNLYDSATKDSMTAPRSSWSI